MTNLAPEPECCTDASPDPLRYEVPLECGTVVYPLGFPLRVTTNSPEIVAAVEALWGQFDPMFDREPIDLRLAVSQGAGVRPDPAPFPTGQGHLITIVHSPANFAVTDVDRGFIYGWLTADTANDRSYLSYHFLEPLVYLTLSCLYVLPVHAAGVALRGQGVLLCGESGAGKTSLAYEFAKRGWTYLADDAVYVVRGSSPLRIVGKPQQIRFRSSAKKLFPELAEFREVVRPNGKPDLELSAAALGISNTAREMEPSLLVFLKREPGAPAHSRPVSAAQVLASLEHVICYGPPEARHQQRRTLEKLVGVPAIEMVYSDAAGADTLLRKFL